MYFSSGNIVTAIAVSDLELTSLNTVNGSGSNSAAKDLSGIRLNTDTTSSAGNIFTINPYFGPNHFKFIFGDNAFQNSTTITIQKSDMPGLTPFASNTDESLFVGLINIALLGKNTVELPGISFKYWGYGKDGSKRIDTVLIEIRNKLVITNEYELPELSLTINPDDY